MNFSTLNNTNNLIVIAGPCVVESEKVMNEVAESLCIIQEKLPIELVFKASFYKANRSKLTSFTGIGAEKALRLIQQTAQTYGLASITDIHSVEDVERASEYVDILQIPAFLCRQTDLLVAAAKSGKIVNIKKGQFLSPEAMKFAVEKVKQTGNEQVLLTERGTTFGYQDLVVDMRSIPIMQAHGTPTILDVTHSLQRPNQTAGVTGGTPQFIEHLASAGVAAGVDGVFIETHPNTKEALSDGANMLPLNKLEALIGKLCRIKSVI